MINNSTKIVRMISSMDIGSTFTFGDLASQIFDGDADIIRSRSGFINRYLRYFVNSGILVVETTEQIGKRKKYSYKKIADIFFKEVVIEWVEGFPDNWVAKTYLNGELVSEVKDW